MNKKYNISGMSCAACSARVEKAVSGVEGVRQCSVNLLTNSMTVEGDADTESIFKAVIDAGYGIQAAESETKKSRNQKNDEKIATDEILKLKGRLYASLIFLAGLMYVSMGYAMWGFPLPQVIASNPLCIGLIQMLLTVIIMIINQRFFVSGFKAATKGSPNMDTLVAMGSGAAFGYSVYILFEMTALYAAESAHMAEHLIHELYFESAAMILTLITVGKLLESRSKGKTADALRGLIDLAPKTARVIRDGKEETVPADTLKVGDIFAVRPGESIPTDAVVIEGITAVDESALTGESLFVDKNAGDTVTGATINRLGFIKCRTLREAQDTTLAQIISLVSDASASKVPISKAADRVSGVFVPLVLGISAITLIAWLAVGSTVGYALARAISVLVISCPCALGLATPVAVMVGSGVGAKNGILFKTAAALEELGKIKTVALDKTGTVTSGEPIVTDFIADETGGDERLLQIAASLESKSEHPLAKAILKKAEEMSVSALDSEGFEALTGSGVSAYIDGKLCIGGSLSFISQKIELSDKIQKMGENLAEEGKTPLCFVCDGKLLGIIAVADSIKKDSPKAVAELKKLGLKVVMLTGDNEKTAKAVAMQTGIDEVIAGVMPQDKSRAVEELRQKGKVAMVGDGINDAPALTAADIGVAIGAGSDIAIDAADVVLMKNSLLDVAAAIRLSRKTLKNIYENLFWAFAYNIVGIPLAAGAFVRLFGWEMNPMFGAAAMSLSSFFVVSNALRLNLAKLYGRTADGKKEKTVYSEEVNNMIKTLKIEGMMCPHCEANVKSALEEIDGVVLAQTSHKEGTAVVELSAEISDALLIKTVEDKGYKVTSVE